MSTGYPLREAGPADTPVMLRHRREMLTDMGRASDIAALDDMLRRFDPWVRARLADGTYFAWFAEHEGAAVSGVGMWLRPRHPGLGGPQTETPYILNVYTEPSHRGRGLARQLVTLAVERARALGYTQVELHPSDQGRPIYESMGFKATTEMRLLLG